MSVRKHPQVESQFLFSIFYAASTVNDTRSGNFLRYLHPYPFSHPYRIFSHWLNNSLRKHLWAASHKGSLQTAYRFFPILSLSAPWLVEPVFSVVSPFEAEQTVSRNKKHKNVIRIIGLLYFRIIGFYRTCFKYSSKNPCSLSNGIISFPPPSYRSVCTASGIIISSLFAAYLLSFVISSYASFEK